MKYSHSKAMAVFYKIVKLVKNGVLMMIHIYAKVSLYGIININKLMLNITLVWQGEVDTTLSQLSNTIEQALNRAPLVFGGHDKPLKRIAWCTGGAQSYIEHAINISFNTIFFDTNNFSRLILPKKSMMDK
jgi:hypothetical protein